MNEPKVPQRYRIAVKDPEWRWDDFATGLSIDFESDTDAMQFINHRLRPEYRANKEFKIMPGPPFALPGEASSVDGSEQKPRELLCGRCGHDYVVWFAPNQIWNRVVRDHCGNDPEPFLCPTCFTILAEERGVVPTAWEVRPEAIEQSLASQPSRVDIDELQKLYEASTPGEWCILGVGQLVWIEPSINTSNGYEGEIKSDDAAFIAAAHNAFPALLKELREKQKFVEMCKRYGEMTDLLSQHLAASQAENAKLREACELSLTTIAALYQRDDQKWCERDQDSIRAALAQPLRQ